MAQDPHPLPAFSIGVDYGTNSVRALVVEVNDGREVADHVFNYPSGQAGILLDPQDPLVARQHPGDYLQGFIEAVSGAVKKASQSSDFTADRVVGLGVDTTGSTPIPVDQAGNALGMQDKFRDNLHAQAWLWKDHTSHEEAAEITAKAAQHPDRYLDKCGGVYSSEWYWSKILRCCRSAPEVFAAAYSWVELADFVPGQITGQTDPHTMARGVCAAGHKAMWHDDWNGLPRKDFLDALDPKLSALRDRYADHVSTNDAPVGGLTAEYAQATGLPEGLPVATGLFDAHAGAVGCGVKPGTLVKIIGTSTCDITVWPSESPLDDIPGVCGIVPGSVVPGDYGLEAGQSAVGDIFNWFVNHLCPAKYGSGGEAHAALTREAQSQQPGQSGLLALDWNNGNRTVLVDPLLSGLLLGQTLHTTAPEVYRALIEATAFGARKIIDRFEQYGVKVEQVVNCGGIAEKNPMAMQIYADVCNRPMLINPSGQTCALGAAIFGAVVGGAHSSTLAAQSKMAPDNSKVYKPIPKNVAVYERLYRLYTQLHDGFGLADHQDTFAAIMKELIDIRDAARTAARDA
ncbi:MAG: ribulokinase [Planctomycetota bacterium]